MKNDKILLAIGNIDGELIDRARPKNNIHPIGKAARVTFSPWLRRAVPVAACLVIAGAILVPVMLKQPPVKSGDSNAQYDVVSEAPPGTNDKGQLSHPGSEAVPPPSLSLNGEVMSAACYAAPEDWRGLPTEKYVLAEQSNGIAADRMLFTSLDDLAAYADAFVLIPYVHKTAQDGVNMQTSIAEYATSIGDILSTRQWDDHTISTGSRVLIRQQLIGGCTMDEPNNLLREGGVYLLPIKLNPDWGAYEVVGDLDVLFELNDEGKIVSHSQWEGFNKYDGKSFSGLLDDVSALYPELGVELIEQPIDTLEQAIKQVTIAYNASGYRKFSIDYKYDTVIEGVDAYLFTVSFGDMNSEYAAIAKENGAFIRGEIASDGEFITLGGLGGFPWDR